MYDIVKQRGTSLYYVTHDGEKISAPFKDKKMAARMAAKLNGMSMKEFMKARKENDSVIRR